MKKENRRLAQHLFYCHQEMWGYLARTGETGKPLTQLRLSVLDFFLEDGARKPLTYAERTGLAYAISSRCPACGLAMYRKIIRGNRKKDRPCYYCPLYLPKEKKKETCCEEYRKWITARGAIARRKFAQQVLEKWQDGA